MQSIWYPTPVLLHTPSLPVLQEMPAAVVTLLYGALAPVYIAEAVTACRETGNSIPLIVDMLAQVHNTPAYPFVSFPFLVLTFSAGFPSTFGLFGEVVVDFSLLGCCSFF